MSTNQAFLKNFRTVRKTDQFSEFELITNGLRVVLIPHESPTNALSCTMNYHVGSYDETVGFTGSAHFLEHLCFKDPLKGDKKNIFQSLDKWGATINATTSENRTNFYCVIPELVFNKWAEAEAERVRNIPFDIDNRDKKESAVVVDELRMGNDNPYKRLTEVVMGAAYDRSGYNHLTSGFIADVEETSQEKLHAFWKNFYGPNNCSMVIVGNVKPEKVLFQVDKHFSDIEAREVKRNDREEIKQEGPRQVYLYTKKPYSMVQIAFKNMEGMHPDSITLDLIAELMQYPKIGILQVLHENNFLPMFNVINNRKLHRHLFQITAGVPNPSVVPNFQTLLWKWFESISTQEIPDNVIKMAKLKLKNKWNKMYENGVESIGAAATEAIAMGNVGDIFERYDHLEKVTMADIQRVAKYTFRDSRCTVGMLMPHPQDIIERPLKDEHYENTLFQIEHINKDVTVGIKNVTEKMNGACQSEMQRYNCSFGQLQHLELPCAKRKTFMISTQAFSDNVSLGELVCKIITDGIDKTMAKSKSPNLLFGSNNEDTFAQFQIQKNLDFQIYSGKGRLNMVISFDKEHDTHECLQRVASAIQQVKKLEGNELKVKIQACAGSWTSQEHDVNSNAHQQITEAMFTEDDNNYILGVQEKISLVNAVTRNSLDGFLTNLFDKSHPFMVTALSEDSVSELENVLFAFRSKFQQLKKDKKQFVPFENRPSNMKKYKSKTLEYRQNGLEDGMVQMGIRVPIDRTHKDFTALRVASDVLGDGIYSRLNLPLRVEKGLTYGTYSRMRGGHHGSDSYMHVFGSFKVEKLKEARKLMDDILNKFTSEGITEQEFKEKKKHLKYSLKVRMDSVGAELMMQHQTLLNGNTLGEIQERIEQVTYDEVNEAIAKYLAGKPRVVVLGGLPEQK